MRNSYLFSHDLLTDCQKRLTIPTPEILQKDSPLKKNEKKRKLSHVKLIDWREEGFHFQNKLLEANTKDIYGRFSN